MTVAVHHCSSQSFAERPNVSERRLDHNIAHPVDETLKTKVAHVGVANSAHTLVFIGSKTFRKAAHTQCRKFRQHPAVAIDSKASQSRLCARIFFAHQSYAIREVLWRKEMSLDNEAPGLVYVPLILYAGQAVRKIAHTFNGRDNDRTDNDFSTWINKPDLAISLECEESGLGSRLLGPEW